ncbi:MAG: response regulator [Chloroflexi bacterium]|nr:response regulator [Chloroflexota bacterium]
MDRKPKILLIDDDIDFVQATSKVLESKSWEILVAFNGEEGLQKARKERPDLVLLDIMMPVKDGFLVAEEFGKDQSLSKIPVLALTSFSDPLGQPFPFEVSEYIRKPVRPKELLAKVEKYLGETDSQT